MAEDFIGVPGEEWWQVRQAVRDLNALLMLAWIALAALVVILFRKGIISVADLRPADG